MDTHYEVPGYILALKNEFHSIIFKYSVSFHIIIQKLIQLNLVPKSIPNQGNVT